METPAVVGRQSLAVAGRILRELVRQRRGLVFWAVFPTLMMLLFGLIYRHNPAMRGGFDLLPAGILIGAALFFSCLGGTVSIVVAERERRTLRRLLASPLHPVAYFAGITLALAAVAAGQSAIVFVIAWALGARFQGSAVLGTAIVVLTVVTYVGLGFFFGARLARRAEDVNGPVAAFGVPLLVLGGTFFPLQIMPAWLVGLAQFNPVLHMNEAMKGVVGRGEGLAQIGTHLALLVVFALASLAAGVLAYRRMLADERRG